MKAMTTDDQSPATMQGSSRDLADVMSDRESSELDRLSVPVQEACNFADRWPERYRTEIFREALRTLIGDPPRDRSSFGILHRGNTRRIDNAAEPVGGSIRVAIDKLASALAVDPLELERAVHFEPDAAPRILGRIESKSVREAQIRYTLAYCYLQEFGLGIRHTSIEDLRTLCIEHGCYDKQNFSTNFKKGADDDLLREIADRAGSGRKFMATKAGLELGGQLLRGLIEQ